MPRLVIIPYHPNIWTGRFNSYTPAVMVPIYKVTRVIKMLNFHQNVDFREKNLSSQNFRILPDFTTFTHFLTIWSNNRNQHVIGSDVIILVP